MLPPCVAFPADSPPLPVYSAPLQVGPVLGAKGTTINIETDGPDEEAAMTALTRLIADYFGEGE